MWQNVYKRAGVFELPKSFVIQIEIIQGIVYQGSIRNMVYSSNKLSFFLKQWKHRQRKKHREIIICTNLHNFYKLASISILFYGITFGVSEQIKRLATWFKLGAYGLRRFSIWFQKILHIFIIIIIEISKKWSTEFVGYT